jgi:hypothetical protein
VPDDGFEWPDGVPPESSDWWGVDGLMGIEHAIEMALEGEKRGLAYYEHIAGSTSSERVRAAAEGRRPATPPPAPAGAPPPRTATRAPPRARRRRASARGSPRRRARCLCAPRSPGRCRGGRILWLFARRGPRSRRRWENCGRSCSRRRRGARR